MKTNRPILVAVGGDSGTGKTTLVSGLYRIFGSDRITNICLDDYHKLDRAARKRLGVTALNPAANDLELMAEHVRRLRHGETIRKPTYDHSTGSLGPAETVAPRDIIVIRGLFPLFTADLREAFDVRIWLDPQEELKWSWKVRRDCAQRGYSVPEVIRQLMDRREDQLAYVAPQRAHADLVVRFEAPPGYFLPGTAVEHDDAHLDVRIDLHEQLPRLDLDDVLATGNGRGQPAIRFRDGDGREPAAARFATLEIDGKIATDRARELDERIWAHLERHRHLRPDDIGAYLDGATARHSDPLALTQLIVAYQIIQAGIERGGRLAAEPAGHARLVATGAARG
ncbi:MAG TPA: phosphoribulokinase [Candidatus Limnocylindrales bacterium]|nr:phosphoribulokinase [Candidatus Limnocylindrales bacterium]